jgi:hypothetical protein
MLIGEERSSHEGETFSKHATSDTHYSTLEKWRGNKWIIYSMSLSKNG